MSGLKEFGHIGTCRQSIIHVIGHGLLRGCERITPTLWPSLGLNHCIHECWVWNLVSPPIRRAERNDICKTVKTVGYNQARLAITNRRYSLTDPQGRYWSRTKTKKSRKGLDKQSRVQNTWGKSSKQICRQRTKCTKKGIHTKRWEQYGVKQVGHTEVESK